MLSDEILCGGVLNHPIVFCDKFSTLGTKISDAVFFCRCLVCQYTWLTDQNGINLLLNAHRQRLTSNTGEDMPKPPIVPPEAPNSEIEGIGDGY